MKKIIFTILILLTGLCVASPALAVNDTYPKIANYYLDPFVPEGDFEDLAKYDLIVFDIDLPRVRPELIEFLKKENPDILLYAYITSQSVADIDTLSDFEKVRTENYKAAKKNNWWLKNSKGENITYSDVFWFIKCIDPSDEWNGYLTDMIKKEVEESEVWDGVFLDVLVSDITWLNGGDVDIDQDGKKDTREEMNSYWQEQMNDLLDRTRQKISKPVIANVNPIDIYEEKLNGVLLEDFPAKWFGKNSWSISMKQYLKELPKKNRNPQIYVLNSTSGNTGNSKMYKEMRFGLSSTLLGDGYHSFDFGFNEHSQAWWYDEYEVVLGTAESEAYNLLDKESEMIKPGLWRRDFYNGITLVNSTDREQVYIFSHEEFEKINGSQDKQVNNGEKINLIKIPSMDGRILLKINNSIIDSSFNNGSFVRVFDSKGEKKRNGFFSYKDIYQGNTQVLISDIDADGVLETLVNGGGKISIYKNGKLLNAFMPYSGKFIGEVSFAVSDLNGDGTKEIITGAGRGGGPHVRVFNIKGEPITGGFFAYGENFRGGVSVAVIDLNGDGTKEIVTGAGIGGGPHVRVFTKDGKSLTGGFMAYDDSYRGGVSVSVGDIDSDGVKEIITGAGVGDKPLVRIFDRNGILLEEFLAYKEDIKKGIKVISDDIDRDGVDEIMVSLIE